jgi:methyl-accepting chemotaxis protein
MKVSIGQKLFIGSLIFILSMGGVIAGSWLSMNALRHLQDQGMERVRTAAAAQRLSGQGAALYQIVADAEINHQLDQTRQDWAAEKRRTESMYADMRRQLSSPDDLQKLDDSYKGYHSYIDLFENRMMPALVASDQMTPAIRDLDGQVDGARDQMQTPLAALSTSAERAAQTADDAFDASALRAGLLTVSAGLAALLIGSVLNLLIVRHISTPLKTLAGLLHRLVEGQDVQAVPYERRTDEVGDVAHAVSAFRDNILDVKRLEAEQRVARAKLERDNERARGVLASAETFESQIKAVAQRIGLTSRDLNAAAATLDEAARDANERTASMAAATEQSSVNLQTVASATEELSASISEISRQVEETTLMTQEATHQAQKTGETVDELARAASRIGEVVALIQDIAAQTNLLALNATIEAARAGAAGAGFAVVAGEVKNLSAQTSRATSEIRDHIQSMQKVTDETVEAIRNISHTVERINSVTGSIAAGVTEQSAATAEIANNVAQVADGAATLNTDISQVSAASRQTSATSGHVLDGAGHLEDQVRAMSEEVDSFLNLIRVDQAA